MNYYFIAYERWLDGEIISKGHVVRGLPKHVNGEDVFDNFVDAINEEHLFGEIVVTQFNKI